MLLSNPARTFPFLIAFSLVFSAGCSSHPTDGARILSDTFNAARPPFPTAEPENFQAEFVITTAGSTRTFFAARKGDRRRYDYGRGTAREVRFVSAGGDYVISPALKAYARAEPQAAPPGGSDGSLTRELLSSRVLADFTYLGMQDGLDKYSSRSNGSDTAGMYIYIDRTIALPVRQEFFAVVDGREVVQYKMEIRNFSTEVDDSVFALPPGLRMVSAAEMGRLRSGTGQ